LAKVACVVKRSIRTPADLVARYGGEEFVVVLPSSSLNEAALVAQRICQRRVKSDPLTSPPTV
ncbi:diguanylate cyclase, partial [Salmonella enterica]